MRKQIGTPKILQKKLWNYTAYELQEIADFLDGQVRGVGKEYMGGLPFDYVYFGADGREWYKVKPYKSPKERTYKLYSKLIPGFEPRFLVSGEPMLDRNNDPMYIRKPVGSFEDEILSFLKAEDIIKLVQRWRKEAAEERVIDDPHDKRDMPPEFRKKQVYWWCNKEGIDESKYTLKPSLLKDYPEIIEAEVTKMKERENLTEEIKRNRANVYSSYGRSR